MNYKHIYDQLVKRGRLRKLDCYVERHHIVPRCMSGLDDESNLVELTPEEHYVAHQLLVKIYPHNHKLARAAHMMTVGSSIVLRSNKLYGWVRRKLAEAQSASQSGEGNSQYGTRWASNEFESKKIQVGDSLPEGWHWGKLTKIKAENIEKHRIKAEILSKAKAEIKAQKIEQDKRLYRQLYEIYIVEGFEGVQKTGYEYSGPNMLYYFAKHIPEFVPQSRKRRAQNSKKKPQLTKSLVGTGICDDSWDTLFALYNELILTLPKMTASRVAYQKTLAVYPQITLTERQVQLLTGKYAEFGRTLKEHARAYKQI